MSKLVLIYLGLQTLSQIKNNVKIGPQLRTRSNGVEKGKPASPIQSWQWVFDLERKKAKNA